MKTMGYDHGQGFTSTTVMPEKITDARPILIMTVGLPLSGKSTWARGQDCPVVCPDEIRLAIHGQRFVASAEPYVWAVAKTMVKALFGAGHDTVVLDATNTTRRRRDEWRSSEWIRFFQVFETDPEPCRERAVKAGDDEIVPVIERMAGQFELVEREEVET